MHKLKIPIQQAGSVQHQLPKLATCPNSRLAVLPTSARSASCATQTGAAASARGAPLVPFQSRQAASRTVQALAESTPFSTGSSKKIGVLFVCLGNICRSPSAEAVFRATVEKAGLADCFNIGSCGTGGGSPDWFRPGGWSYHEGDPSDQRMAVAASRRGVYLTSRSRPLVPVDLAQFDYIIGMDARNIQAIKTAGDFWQGQAGQGAAPGLPYDQKLSLMTSYCNTYKGTPEVPDPYYGGPAGFEKVLDLLEDACVGLLSEIRTTHTL